MSYTTSSFDDKVIKSLKNGDVGLLPSDTIYGLSCLAISKAAVKRLRTLKKRDESKPFIILIADYQMLDSLGVRYNKVITDKYWPGQLTLILPAPSAPAWLKAEIRTLAVRMPDDSDLEDLIKRVGPIISTSANLAGGQPAESAIEARQYFGDKLDFYVDVGPIKNQPSTIVKLEDDRLTLIRQGATKLKESE